MDPDTRIHKARPVIDPSAGERCTLRSTLCLQLIRVEHELGVFWLATAWTAAFWTFTLPLPNLPAFATLTMLHDILYVHLLAILLPSTTIHSFRLSVAILLLVASITVAVAIAFS